MATHRTSKFKSGDVIKLNNYDKTELLVISVSRRNYYIYFFETNNYSKINRDFCNHNTYKIRSMDTKVVKVLFGVEDV